jgi:plastocyanin
MGTRSSNHRPTRWAATLGGVVLLVVAGCSGTTRGSASPIPGSAAPAEEIALKVRDFALEPKDLTVHGSSLAIGVTNAGPTVHNVTVRDAAGKILAGTPDLREGASAPLTGALPPGSYVLFCSLPGHESLGIRGTLTVDQP